MPKPAYATCRNCGRHRDEVGTLTRSRLCVECWPLLERLNALSIHHKEGAPYLRQQVRQYMASRKALLDAGLISS